ncbi:hypothetical protein G5V59_26625 [Nocardioides sp. W3-2-3]|uniref:septum formation family protein n=1 Tax=Nocardioides convexus TaxID=2712224 RepID=UPI0024187742|nr:septum formation family protein [Nocardioides convexus]NHA01981.1 hypothetical protein [Nocardioides convexus]
MRLRHAVAVVCLGLLGAGLSGCGSEDQGGNTDPDLVDAVEVPKTGVCRDLSPDDVAKPANATAAVDCASRHTAETYAAADLPAEYDDADYDDPDLGTYAYRTCSTKFAEFVGADESLVLRTTVSWAWFRPSEKAWSKGARWYRCDVIGGNSASPAYRALPRTARGMLSGRPDNRLAGLRQRPVGRTGREGALLAEARLARGHDREVWASPTTSTPATG